MPASNLSQFSPWEPNTPFQAYSCAGDVSWSFAKPAQELVVVDDAKLVHMLAIPEGVGEGIFAPSGSTAWASLAGLIKFTACLLIVFREAFFGLSRTAPMFA